MSERESLFAFLPHAASRESSDLSRDEREASGVGNEPDREDA